MSWTTPLTTACLLVGALRSQDTNREVPQAVAKARNQAATLVANEIRRIAGMELGVERQAALARVLSQPKPVLRRAFPLSHRYMTGIGGGDPLPREPYWGEERAWDAWTCRTLCRLPDRRERESIFLACFVLTEANAWTKAELEYSWNDMYGYGSRAKVAALAGGLKRKPGADLEEHPCYLSFIGKDLGKVLEERAVDRAAFRSPELTSVALDVEERGGKLPFPWIEIAKHNLAIEDNVAIHAILDRLCRKLAAKQRQALARELLSAAVQTRGLALRHLAIERATWVLSSKQHPWNCQPMEFVTTVSKGWRRSNRIAMVRAFVQMGIDARLRPAPKAIQVEIDRELPRLVALLTGDEAHWILRGYMSSVLRIDAKNAASYRELIRKAHAGSSRWRKHLESLRAFYRPNEHADLDKLLEIGKQQ